MFEKGVPLRGLHVRNGRMGGLWTIDAIRLDTGMMVKLTGGFDEVDPLRPFVADILQKRIMENVTPVEIEYKVGPNKTGPETVLSAVERKRSEAAPPYADIPAEFRIGYTVTETYCVSPDKSGGPYRIFEAEVGSTKRLAKIVARVPDPERRRPIRMALKASKDRNGNPQREGIYQGEADTDPISAFAPELLAPPKRNPMPPAPAEPVPAAGPRREQTNVDGFRHVQVTREVVRKPAKNDLVFLLLETRDKDNGERLRLYLDVPEPDAAEIALFSDFFFRETSRNDTGRAVELRGDVMLSMPEAKLSTTASTSTLAAANSSLATPDSEDEPDEGRFMRIRHAQEKDIRPYPGYAKIHREIGPVQYFAQFLAEDVDTGETYQAKLYLPEKSAHLELYLPVNIRTEKGKLCIRNSSAHPPPEIAAMDFEAGEWKRYRVRGGKPITNFKTTDGSGEVYHIFDAKIVGKESEMKIMGYVPGGDTERLMTVLVRPNKYRHGELQYEAALIEPDPVVSRETMCEMIRKLKAPGIGAEHAEKITNRFGMESLHVIRYEPERLTEIKGISEGTVAQIRNANHLDLSASILQSMARNGVHTRYFSKILRTFNSDAVEIIDTDPYRLTVINGITFEYADKIAVENQNLSRLSPVRIAAALDAVKKSLMNSGKCADAYTWISSLIFAVTKDVGWSDSKEFGRRVRKHIEEQSELEDGTVRLEWVDGDELVRFQDVVRAERRIAEEVYKRMRNGPDWIGFDPTQYLRTFERVNKMELGEEQAQAVRMVCKNGTSIMTGGPGVGKTTTLKAAVGALESVGIQVILGAPTGIASKRMRESTERPASTVHSLISQLDRSNEMEPVISAQNPSCLVIDETSMVNVFTLQDLLKDLPDNTSIMFCGDVDQLPSIGPGEVLRDLIRSEMIPVTRLIEVYRNGKDSGIVAAAQAINQDEIPKPEKDFQITDAKTNEEISDETIRQVQILRDKYENSDKNLLDNLMVLSPTKKGPAGVVALNTRLQKLLNPASRMKAEFSVPRPPEDTYDDDDDTPTAEELKKRKVHHEILRVGDKVINTRNEKSSGLVNGDTGLITYLDAASRTVCVEFDGAPQIFEKDDLKDIRLAYAMTVHKSQGSEAKNVIFPLPNIEILLTRPLFYTGITRGKDNVSVIGERSTISFCVGNIPDNNAKLRRHSTLAAQCRHLMEYGLEQEAEPDEDGDPDPC